MKKTFFAIFAAATVFLLAACTTSQTATTISTALRGAERIDKYGGLHFDMTAGEFLTNGFAIADLVEIKIAGNEIGAPVVSNYRHVDQGKVALVASDDPGRPLFMTIFYGDAATTFGIAHKFTYPDKTYKWVTSADLEFPLPVEIRLVGKGAYAARIPAEAQKRSNNRADYPALTDADFANFRAVTAPGITSGVVYRSSSPLNPVLGRSTFADNAAKAAGVKSVVNMVDTEAEAKAFPGWDASYCGKCPTLFRPMGVDVTGADFAHGLKDCLAFMADGTPPFLLHCKEGQDRTGFACAVLELLQGATFESAAADYVATFRNYYGVMPGSDTEKRLRANLAGNLKAAFKVEDVESSATLSAAARSYLLGIGLADEQIVKLQGKLTGGK